MTAKATPKSEKTSVPIYVIAGKERDLVNLTTDELLDKLVEPSQRQTGLFNTETSRITIAEVLDELRTLPFLTDKRVVLIKDADDFVSKNREQLERYFDSPSTTAVLILTVNNWPANTKLARKLSKVGKLVTAASPKPWQLPQRLVQYAADAYDKTLTRQAAELLVELTGDNLAQLYSEVDKLTIYVLDKKTITIEDVESLTGHNRLFNAFAVIDSVTTGDIAGAIDRLRKMFAADKSTEFTVVGAFAFHLRRMFNAKALLEKGRNPSQVASELRIWGKKDAFFNQLKKMSLKQIGDGLQQLAQIDYQIKTGQTNPKIAIEQLVMRLVVNW